MQLEKPGRLPWKVPMPTLSWAVRRNTPSPVRYVSASASFSLCTSSARASTVAQKPGMPLSAVAGQQETARGAQAVHAHRNAPTCVVTATLSTVLGTGYQSAKGGTNFPACQSIVPCVLTSRKRVRFDTPSTRQATYVRIACQPAAAR